MILNSFLIEAYAGPEYGGSFEKYAIDKMAVYKCFECKKPYPAGKKECDRAERNEEELMCQTCVALKVGPIKGVTECDIHGKDFIIYKCRFCCSPSEWFCWGDTHFCDSCHDRQNNEEFLDEKDPDYFKQCGGSQNCPLKLEHPPNGTVEYALWCGLCHQ